MVINWHQYAVPMKFQLGDKTLFKWVLQLKVREEPLHPTGKQSAGTLAPPHGQLDDGCAGFLVHSLPAPDVQARVQYIGAYICYVSSRYDRYYIDLQQTFANYRDKFSSKSRSTINRKIRKFAEMSGGSIVWRTYRSPDEMMEFYRTARTVSSRTYQEKLLDAGLPESEDFCKELETLAARDLVRGYILFDRERPVSYLCCPIRDDVVLYQFLGYDPDYMRWSVGTVLQWYALEQIFQEGRFMYFDFTEGQSEHKRFFATASVPCANVYFLRRTMGNALLVHSHIAMDELSRGIGRLLAWVGLKRLVKRIMRFGV